MHSRIGDIHMLEIRREFNAVGSKSIVRNCLHYSSVWLKAISLVLDDRCRTEVLPVAVRHVCEPQVTCYRVLSDIIDGREVTAEEVVDQNLACVGCWVYENQLGRVGQVALVAEDDLLALAAVCR